MRPFNTYNVADGVAYNNANLDIGPEYSCDLLWTCRNAYRYSDPAIVLWQRNGPDVGLGIFKILAYRTITAADGLTTGSGTSLVLKPWVTLMVRLIEGYELPFNTGMVDAAGKHLKYGDIITNGTKSARIIGTPIIGIDDFVNVRPSLFDDPRLSLPFIETMTAEKLFWAETPARYSYAGFPSVEDFQRLVEEFAACR